MVGSTASPGDANRPTIQVAAEGRVSVAPDMVELSLMVQHRSPTSKDAYDTVNIGVNTLKKILKDAGVQDADVQTTSISMNPEYNYENGKTTPNGFSASHSLSVKVRKLESVNTLLDSITSIADLQIQGISYDLSDKDKVYSDARKLALEKAFQKAQEIAKTTGTSIKKVYTISEGTSVSNPPIYQNFKMAVDMGTAAGGTSNIAVGQLEYTIDVNVTYELN
jgi:hypothetical protein